ncbi:MAG: hypothetical protein LH480_04575 [Rubrivivax sp.]|nr:hypothetical protein [Rubrivivax sp.]
MRTIWSFVGVVLVAAAGAAGAQPVLRVESSVASGCLTASDPDSPEPEYPFVEYKLNTAGRVLVELRFAGPALRPAVEVIENSGGAAFVNAVKDHAKTLRVPCMAADAEPVSLRRHYVFTPLSQQVNSGPAEDAGAARRMQLAACLVNQNGPAMPNYSAAAQRQALQGRVIAQMSFTAPDKPPVVQLLHRPYAQDLTAAVAAWIQNYRLPCFVPGQDTVMQTSALFTFRLDKDVFGFRPLTLTQFMASTPNLGLRPLVVDTNTMGCPFALRLWYRQPALRNIVSTVGPYVAAREPLLDWLRGASLELKSAMLDSVYGDTADITVPCVKLNIQPKEKL